MSASPSTRRAVVRSCCCRWRCSRSCCSAACACARRTGRCVFLPPPLVTLCLAALAHGALPARGPGARPAAWVSADLPLLVSAQHALTLLALFAATAQAINSVLPEQGLLHWVFALCFFWTLWQDQFRPGRSRAC